MTVLAAFVPGPIELVVVGLVWIIVGVLPVIVFWKICDKAGFPGPLGLLMLLPVANFILPLYIAFADWPALENQAPHASDTP